MENFFLNFFFTKSEPSLVLPNWNFSSLILKLVSHNFNFTKRFQKILRRNLAPIFRAKTGFVWSQEGEQVFGGIEVWSFGIGARRTQGGRAQGVEQKSALTPDLVCQTRAFHQAKP